MQSPETTEALVRLADQLGVAVTELWRVARSMPVYRAMSAVPWVLAASTLSAVLYRRYSRGLRRAEAARSDTSDAYAHFTARDIEKQAIHYGVLAIVLGAVALIFTAIAASHLVGLLNPDAYALEYILNRISR